MKNKNSQYVIGIDRAEGVDTSVFVEYKNGIYTVIAEAQVDHNKAICTDYDEECVDVKDKTRCWLYDCSKGLCPYLQ